MRARPAPGRRHRHPRRERGRAASSPTRGAHHIRQLALTVAQPSRYLDGMSESAEVVAQATSRDPEVGLRAVASLRALLEAVEELQVKRARELGWSWQQIAALLGVSKQAVHQKFGAAERRPRRRRR